MSKNNIILSGCRLSGYALSAVTFLQLSPRYQDLKIPKRWLEGLIEEARKFDETCEQNLPSKEATDAEEASLKEARELTESVEWKGKGYYEAVDQAIATLIDGYKDRISELESALRMNLSVAPNNPILIEGLNVIIDESDKAEEGQKGLLADRGAKIERLESLLAKLANKVLSKLRKARGGA